MLSKMTFLQPKDGHILCPSCLGFRQLSKSLSEDACMNCSYVAWTVRTARQAEVQQLLGSVYSQDHSCTPQLTPAQWLTLTQPGHSKHLAAETVGASSRKKAKESKLASRVDPLTADFKEGCRLSSLDGGR